MPNFACTLPRVQCDSSICWLRAKGTPLVPGRATKQALKDQRHLPLVDGPQSDVILLLEVLQELPYEDVMV